MNKQQLASRIWESANQMRSKIEANEYKDYILGFIFYKFLSDKQISFAKRNEFSSEDIKSLSEDKKEEVGYIKKNIGYFIAYDHLFSTWIEKGKDFDISDVRDALSAFSRLIHPNHKRLFDSIFKTLETGLSKLGENSAKQTKAVSGLLQLIKDIPMDGRQGYDVLGFIYEYLISMFAANAGKKAGEFYTPHEVSLLMSEIVADHVKDREKIQIYDPTSGSGSLLINIGHCAAKYMDGANNIKYFAQELKENTYNLTRMNLVMRGLLPENIDTRNGDTLEDDWPYFDEADPAKTYFPLYVDAVVSNPPYSQKWDPDHKESDPRYARFGLAPKSKADYAFLLHDLYHLKPDGIMTIVLPHGVLFRGGEEGEIRRNLIENNHIDTIIGLPSNIFFGTGIPTIIIVLKQKRDNTDVLIVDASKGFAKEGKNNKLRASDIKRICDTVIGRENCERYAKKVSRDEIRENDYNLNIPRYVDSAEPSESWDIYASMFGGIPKSELDELTPFWQAFPSLRDALFTQSETPYVDLSVSDLVKAVREHADIISFEKVFAEAFDDFNGWLKSKLIDRMLDLNIAKQEHRLGEEIFNRLETIPLIDKYQAYQRLDDEWQLISIDLEILQTEGFDATRVVDPNMVIKTKKGKKEEVQDGWKGRIMPFELVQNIYLKEELDSLQKKDGRLSEISASYEEILDSFSEEEKEAETVNEAGDKFVNAAVLKESKQFIKEGDFEEEFYEAKVIQVADLIAEEKKLKAAIKKEAAALHLLTKKTIEELNDDQVMELLERKWICPLNESLHQLPCELVASLIKKLQNLTEKYSTTYADNAREIHKTEAGLADMIDELEGNDFDMCGLAEFKTFLRGE